MRLHERGSRYASVFIKEIISNVLINCIPSNVLDALYG